MQFNDLTDSKKGQLPIERRGPFLSVCGFALALALAAEFGLPVCASGNATEPIGELAPTEDAHLEVVGEGSTKSLEPVIQGEEVTYTFQLRNAGSSPLRVLKVEESCMCSEAALFSLADDGSREPYLMGAPLDPGQEFELDMIISTEGRRGQLDSYCYLYTNEGPNRTVLQLGFLVQEPFLKSPNSLQVGRFWNAVGVSGEVVVSSNVYSRFELSTPTNLPEGIRVEVSPTPLAKDRGTSRPNKMSWTVRAEIEASELVGPRSFQILLPTRVPSSVDGGEGKLQAGPPLVVYIMGRSESVLASDQLAISFGSVATGTETEETFELSIYDEDLWANPLSESIVNVSPAPMEECLSLTILDTDKPGVRSVRLSYAGGAEPLAPGFFSGAVRIESATEPSVFVEVPFLGVLVRGE